MKEIYTCPELSLINLEDDIITSSPIGNEAPDMDGGEENGFII